MNDAATPTRTESYAHLIQYYGTRERAVLKKQRLMTVMSGTAIVTAAAAFIAATQLLIQPVTVVAVTVGCVALSTLFQVGRSRFAQASRRYQELRRLNEESLARLQRRWQGVPLVDVEIPGQHTRLSADLNLFGPASVFHLICRARTKTGIQTLRDWLLENSSPEEIRQRQQAAEELRPTPEYRQKLSVLCRLFSGTDFLSSSFRNWTEHQPGSLARLRRWSTRLFGLTAAVLLLTVVSGLLPQAAIMPVVTIIVLVNLLITVTGSGPAHDLFRSICPTADGENLLRLHQFFAELATIQGSGHLIDQLRQEAKQAELQIRKLRRIMWFALLARNPWTAIPVYFPLQILVLIDFEVLNQLEDWRATGDRPVHSWLRTVGQLEAVESLASLAWDHPNWATPEIVNAETDRVAARQLGHPLLAENQCVRNDVEVGPFGQLLMITGSNMSGKSTMLRSVGVNAILAQAGSVVCAAELNMPTVVLATSVRVVDDLSDGLSLFMAELQRLKQIIDTAADNSANPDCHVLVLLDEILHGTNSAERHVATLRIIEHLVRHKVIGVLTTHDLQLTEERLVQRACRLVHFREILTEDNTKPLTFDYVMRPGPADATNALRLLNRVGL